MASKYDPLRDYLIAQAKNGRKDVYIDFTFIEKNLGIDLPESARTDNPKGNGYREWWSNEDPTINGHVQSKSWLSAGYHVNGAKSDFANGIVCFEM